MPLTLRDAFEVFCTRGSSTFRGVPQRAVGGMDAKSWRKMLQDSKVYKTPKALAQGVLIFNEVCNGMRVIDIDQFEIGIAKVGERKGMTGSDISAYLRHMAEEFHNLNSHGSSIGNKIVSKEQMKEALKERADKAAKDAINIPKAPVEVPRKKIVAVSAGAGASAAKSDPETEQQSQSQSQSQ